MKTKALSFACLLALLASAGCSTTNTPKNLGLSNRPMQPIANAMANQAQRPAQPLTMQVAPPRQPMMPSGTGQPIALVSHQQVIPNNDGSVQVTAPTYSTENYPGIYETAGFRRHIQSGMCANGACSVMESGCACCSPAQCAPMDCRLPGDPNEYICDGGDQMPDARVKINNDVAGLGLEDTIVHYETQDGLTYVEPSNRVCVYAPRFGSVRKVTTAITGENIIATQRVDVPHGPVGIDRRQPSSAVMMPVGPERNVVALGPDAIRDRNRGVPADNVIQPLLAEDVIAVLANLKIIEQGVLRDSDRPWLAKGGQAAIAWSSEEGAQVVIDKEVVGITINDKTAQELKIYEVGKGRVRLVKLADKRDALPGEFVHFVLRFDNVGDQPVDNVAILDNLTTRLEYVDGSQTCTKGANFSVKANEGESLRLRWELTDSLDVGEGCVIRFKCKVR